MNKKIFCIALVITLMPLTGCTKTDTLINDFVKFDKAYTPALFLTNLEKLNPSKKSIAKLKEEWSSFKGKYYEYYKEDPQWSRDFDKVDQSIMEADKIISSNGDLIEAHEALENIRYTFIKTRRRNNIDYYIDYITDFHDPMEHIVLRAKGKTPETLKEEDIEFIENSLPEVLKLWDAIKSAKFDKDLFFFNEEKVKKMQGIIKAETMALEDLKGALKNKSAKENIIKKAIGIKKNFALLFKLFGDFEGLE
ncbi:MAG: hypothetical protein JRG81_15420 [Deltaproteobacteria bacterium]|nr:hypothetical protein [Deltaproteobacteria bacterium]MBW2181735.1 hypothetical protein [Deltaproteobacteria bacterium]MBW2365852.1 hypothetical protein [Deltaproteobacteria bacterium]